ncbi:WD40 repeat-like protein [Rhizopogon salebrosus TDB-379]|nr:WD40 repeat-like protein [Rhizopogon salebrosus TDB-379]
MDYPKQGSYNDSVSTVQLECADEVMASALKQPGVAVAKMTLEPMTTLENHGGYVQSMHYFPGGKRMISGSDDRTTRQWDIQTGKEIEEARNVYEWDIKAVAVSRDGRWVITAGGDVDYGELRAFEVDRTGIAKTFNGRSQRINCIDICADSTLFASGSQDGTTRIWSLDTGKLVAGPFESPEDYVGAVRFSRDSKKLVVNSDVGRCLEVWNVQTQKLDKRVGKYNHNIYPSTAPVFWTNKETILSVFNFIPKDSTATIYEFNASTLETVGAPFKGHTGIINGLALSFDGALVASASYDRTIKLWAFESRQLLASFHVQNTYRSPLLCLSPGSGQLTYTSGSNIYICNIPPDILTSLGSARTGRPTETGTTPKHLLDSEAIRRPRILRRNTVLSPVISCAPTQQRPLPTTRDSQQHAFISKLREFLRFYSFTGPPVLTEQPRDPLDVPAPSLLHPIHSPSLQATPQGDSHTNHYKNSRRLPASPNDLAPSATLSSFIRRLSIWWSVHGTHAAPRVVDVPLAPGRLRIAVAGAPTNDEDLVPAEYFDIPSSNPDSTQPTAATPINSGEHGSGRLCFCL